MTGDDARAGELEAAAEEEREGRRRGPAVGRRGESRRRGKRWRQARGQGGEAERKGERKNRKREKKKKEEKRTNKKLLFNQKLDCYTIVKWKEIKKEGRWKEMIVGEG